MLFIQKTVENLHGPLIFCNEGCMQDVRFWSLILSAFVQTICSVCRKSRIDSIRLVHVHCRISAREIDKHGKCPLRVATKLGGSFVQYAV
ncbi:hypothetical protein T02_13835 [Trichinella nativa]|uniref:Uncharacterized protein n=1 Tax=Trichinella nativa TaxID=6335 RepID=A0A0V1LB78_9BILA|nr:hypothetical protein T02_13835 [Trichinella nativa]